jgi:hypothetical protein
MNAGSKTIHALLNGVIDYAGLFPPAGLDMTAAVRNYASYLAGEYSWMLGRFIVESARLDEFEKAAAPYFKGPAWKIGSLGIPEKLSEEHGFVVDAIELKAARICDIQPVGGVETYFEIPAAMPLEAAIEAVGKVGARAKIRTGGLTAEAFPDGVRIARFLSVCKKAGVAFKATAGLHHPIRGVHACGTMHGFLNVFLAATLIFTGGSEDDAVQLLEENSIRAFGFRDEAVIWRPHQFTLEQIRSTRERLAISFGSCSFEEPVRELVTLGLL